MPKKLLLFILIFTGINCYSQSNRAPILGKITSDSITLKNVHIFNLSSRKGTISNRYGEFQIPVKENDTLLISDIQYEQQKIIIDKEHLKNVQLIINLNLKINELNEVEIKEHELTGNLNNDAENSNIENNISSALKNLNAYEADTRIVDDFDINKDPDATELTDPTMQATQGNIIGLLNGIGLKALINKASEINEKKRIQKGKQFIYKQKSLSAPNDIRNELGELFFTNTLKILPQNIDDFLNYCKPRGIIHKYINGDKIELIDILITQSKSYHKELNNEKG